MAGVSFANLPVECHYSKNRVRHMGERAKGFMEKKPQDKPQLVTLEQLGEKIIEAIKKLSPEQKAEMRRRLGAHLGLKS
jgi:hypothetical protein